MVVQGRFGLLATGLIAAVLGVQVRAGDAGLLQRLPRSNTPYVQVAALESNQLNVHREFMQADHATGVLQISALVAKSNFEEQWVFIPSTNVWIEIGRGEVASQADSAVELDFEYLKRIAGVYDDLHIVHFHPAGFYHNGRWAEEMFGSDYNASDLQGDEVDMIGLALPSSADVAASVQLVELLMVDNPALELQFSVVSPHGQVRYGATRVGAASIVRNIGNPRMSYVRELATISTIRRGAKNVARTISIMSEPSIGEVIAALCEQSSSEDYSVTFEASGFGKAAIQN